MDDRAQAQGRFEFGAKSGLMRRAIDFRRAAKGWLVLVRACARICDMCVFGAKGAARERERERARACAAPAQCRARIRQI